MRAAMEEAKAAQARSEVPIGAVIADRKTGKILSAAGNRTIEQSDPTAHAEIIAIRNLCKEMGVQRIPGYTLYVTLEPCAMCAAAISFARLDQVIFAATDPKGGGVVHGGKFYDQPTCHHRPDVRYGLLEGESATLLKEFFKARR